MKFNVIHCKFNCPLHFSWIRVCEIPFIGFKKCFCSCLSLYFCDKTLETVFKILDHNQFWFRRSIWNWGFSGAWFALLKYPWFIKTLVCNVKTLLLFCWVTVKKILHWVKHLIMWVLNYLFKCIPVAKCNHYWLDY